MHGKLIEIDAIRNIIARHKTNAQFRQAEFLRKPGNGPRGSGWIGRAEIAEDGNARAGAIHQDWFQQPFQHGFIAGFRIAPAFKLRQSHGAFAQAFEEHGRGQAALDQAAHDRDGGVNPIPGKTGAIADQKQITHAAHSFNAAPSSAAWSSSNAMGFMASRPWVMRDAST